MSIPEGYGKGKQSLIFGAILLLTGTLCFGLGSLAARHNPPVGDTLWIEQLPPEELPGSIPAGSGAGQGGVAPETAAETENVESGGGPAAAGAAASAATNASAGAYVASKNGARYYLPSCGGVSRIKEENKVWFATKSEAEAAGYTPAANCDGI